MSPVSAAEADAAAATDSTSRPGKRPGALTTICVLAIVFGALGFLGTVFGIVGQIATYGMQAAVAIQSQAEGQTQEQQKQTEALSKMMAVTQKYAKVTISVLLLKLVSEPILLVGGIMGLLLKPFGRKVLLIALGSAIFLDVAGAVPGILIQGETRAAMAEMMTQAATAAAQSGPGQLPPEATNAMNSMSSTVGTIGLIVGLGWVIIKIVLYVLGIGYLRKRQVVALFSPAT